MKLERVIKREAEESDRIEGQTEREAHEEVIDEDRDGGSQRTKQLRWHPSDNELVRLASCHALIRPKCCSCQLI